VLAIWRLPRRRQSWRARRRAGGNVRRRENLCASFACAVVCGGSTVDTGAFDHVSQNSSSDAGAVSETSTTTPDGKDAVEAGLNDGNDTVIGQASASTLPAGTFTVAHLTVGYYRFKVAGTIHNAGLSTQVDYSDIEVLTDGTVMDGTVQNHRHYSYTIEVGGSPNGT
jgi:hypothetical protein